jgi:hypothetical protein
MSLGSNTNCTSSALWNEALTATGSGKAPKKIRKSDQIKNPMFLDGAELVSDEYWRDLLIKAAKGKFPRGFSYNDGFLLHRASGITIQIPENPASLVETTVLFLRQKGNIFSPNDLAILESAAQQYLIDGEDVNVAWARIFKAKNSRTKYIRDYIERTYGHLDIRIRDELFTQINTYLELGLCKKEDIVFVQGQIQHIEGLTATAEGVRPTRNMVPKRTKSKALVVDDRKASEYQHYENWVAHLTKLLKYIYSVKSSTITIPSLSGTDS